ncbi:MAG: hypothetical protein HYV16_14315 [Gammaproteobacteria bacterium]|nr:hypothetical protein [Gammaproteobacteria bacterium]
MQAVQAAGMKVAEAELARVLAEAPWALAFVDGQGRIAYANEAMHYLAGTPLLGRAFAELGLAPASRCLPLKGGCWHYFSVEPGLHALPHAAGAGDWRALLERELSRCRRYGSPLSLLVLQQAEADAGAARQQELALRLRDCLRWADLIARDGRGEFVLVLPETGEAALDALRGKLAVQLAGEFPALELGAAAWSRGDDAWLLLQRARAARRQLHRCPA